MDRTLFRLERFAAAALAMLFALLAFYGCWSAPDLVARWGASATGVALLLCWGGVAGWVVAGSVRAPSRGGWAGFAVLAVAMRLASLMLAEGRVSPGDPHWYLELAGHLIAGQGLFFDDPAMGARVYAEFPPVYPLLLAGWGRLAGLSGLSVLTLSTLLDLGAAALIARLGARLGERRAGRAAAALYLIWPSVLFNAPLAQKESLELVLVLALIDGWLGAATRRIGVSALAVGVPAALLALTQPGMAALAGLFGLALAPRIGWRRMAMTGAAGAAVAALAMTPWWLRNWHLLHAFVPLTSVGGLSLWIGENPEATGNWMPYPAALIGLGELECAHRAAALAIEWMTGHPLEVIRLNIAKFLRAAGLGQSAIVRLDAMRPGLAPGVAAALLPLTQGAHVLMLGAGAASLFARRRRVLTALLLAVVVQMGALGVWFEFAERHRELLTPLLLLATAIGVRNAIAWCRSAAVMRRTIPSAQAWARPAA